MDFRYAFGGSGFLKKSESNGTYRRLAASHFSVGDLPIPSLPFVEKDFMSASFRKWPRRSFLYATGGVTLLGLLRPLDRVWSGQADEADTAKSSHTLYVLKIQDGQIPWDAIQEQGLPRPIYVGSPFARQRNPATEIVEYVLWASKSEAEQWAQLEGVQSVREKTERDVVENGTVGDGELFVSLLIRDKTPEMQAKAETYQSNAAVRKRWQALASDSAKITKVSPTKPETGAAISHVIIDGQFRIQASGDRKIPDALIKAIKNHPQVMRIQWKKPFTHMHCPGCGMG